MIDKYYEIIQQQNSDKFEIHRFVNIQSKLHSEELEKNKASKSDLEILDDRVRRKLDGELKSNSQKIHDLEISYYVTENDVTQTKAELKNLWQNYNRLNCK